jgi:phytoene synthase
MRPRSSQVHTVADLSACRELLRAGSKSFSAASRLLPGHVRDAATILYAFCRDADDLVDVHVGGEKAVARLRDRLDHIYAGTPRAFATDRALAAVVVRYAMPRTLLDALIEGFEWDAQGRRYATLAELQAYAARVAGTIGAMMAVLMGARTPAAIARACDLGVAMQLTNIARDVGDDARAGRIYLPLDWLRDAGIDPERLLAEPGITDELRRVVHDLLRVADDLYAGVEAGIARLEPACRPGINAARFIYAEIGHVVRRAGCDSVSRRAVVPGHRKVWLLLKSFAPLAVGADHASGSAPALAATRYLVDAVTAHPHVADTQLADPAGVVPWWRVRTRALWLFELFERMERMERMQQDERMHMHLRRPLAGGAWEQGAG